MVCGASDGGHRGPGIRDGFAGCGVGEYQETGAPTSCGLRLVVSAGEYVDVPTETH